MPVNEDDFETVKEVLFTVARLQEGTSATLDRVSARLDRITANQEQSDRRIDGLATRIDGLTSNVDTLAAMLFRQSEQSEQDRTEARAERERASQDRALMMALIQAIGQGRNGHS